MEAPENIMPDKTYDYPLRLKRIYAIMNWLKKNESRIEETDAVQVTINVKCSRSTDGNRGKDNIDGKILLFPKDN